MDSNILKLMAASAALAWIAVLYKGFSLWRQPKNTAAQVYWAGFFTLAINLTILPPSIAGSLDRILGLPNVSYVLADTAALLTCWAWLVSLHFLAESNAALTRPVRQLGWLVVGIFVFMCARFVIAPNQTLHRFGPSLASIYLAIYRLLFVGAIGLHMVWFIVLLRRYGGTISPSPLRLRLRLMTIAAIAILGFVVSSILWICRVPLPETASALFLFFGVALVVISLTTAKPLFTLEQWLTYHYQSWRLYPLWAALYPVKPTQSLLAPPTWWRRWLPQRDIRFQVHRQVVEILDWILLLQPYAPNGDNNQDARHPQVATLVDALSNWYQVQQSGTNHLECARFVPDISESAALPVTADWTGEVRQLIHIAKQFRRQSWLSTNQDLISTSGSQTADSATADA